MGFLYAAAALAVLILIYLFLIFPGRGKRAAAFAGLKIAHRGLHGDGLTENTLPAFRAARDAGFGVELDVQLSADGIPVVCHDYDLNRVFGIDRTVSSLTAAELREIGVPAFSEVLALLDGRVPLIAEMKGETLDTPVCRASAPLREGYTGLWCVESFNPFHVRWFRKHRPQAIRGQLSTRFGKGERFSESVMNFVLRHLLLNFLGRPQFIAYGYRYDDGVSFRLCRLFGALPVGWTPAGEKEIAEAERRFSTVIFEKAGATTAEKEA